TAAAPEPGEGLEGRPGTDAGGAGAGPGSGWLKGAALLGAAALVSKMIGTLQKIPLQNLAGDRVFGLYSAVYPFYQLLLFLAAAGIPAALSLLAAERTARGEAAGADRLLGTAAVLLAVSGAAGFALMWLGADRAAGWIGDPAAAAAIRASTAALWTMPVMAAFRGYFQGQGRMGPSAASQVAEQTIRVAAMLTLLLA